MASKWLAQRTAVLCLRYLLVIGLSLHAHMAGASEVSSAVLLVERLHEVLADNFVNGDERGFDARVARLEPIVSRAFDFPAITRFALGREFANLDETSKARFVNLIEALSVATYAARFTGSKLTEQAAFRFETLSEKKVRGERILVRTRLLRGQQVEVSLDYVLDDRGAGGQIINVLADGVSDLSLKRAQYAAVIRSKGVEQLFVKITEQLHNINQQGRSGS